MEAVLAHISAMVGILTLLVSPGVADAGNWQVTQLTDNSYVEYMPEGSHSGSGIAWVCSDGSDDEIFYYDGNGVIQLTDNDSRDDDVRISGSRVVWSGWDGNDYEIFLFDGTTTTQLTDNDYSDWGPVVSGTHVAWRVPDNIHYYDGSSVNELLNFEKTRSV